MRLILCVIFCFVEFCAADALQIFVGPEREVKSLEQAAAEVAEARAESPERVVEVVISAGRYELEETLKLGESHSGKENAPVVWRGDGEVILSGGKVLPPFREGAEGIWQTEVPDDLHFEQLWVNQKRATRARFPNQGALDIIAVKETRENRSRAEHVIQLASDRLPTLDAFGERGKVQGLIYHKWDSTRRAIESYDPASGTLTTVGSPMKPWNKWDTESGIVLENAKSLMDAAGEWFKDGNTLYYIPRDGETIETTVSVAPRLEKLLSIDGKNAKELAEHMRFEGLNFSETSWVAPEGGFDPEQAAASIGAVVEVRYAKDVVFDTCEVTRTANYGIWFRKGTVSCSVKNSRLSDLGAGGLRAGEKRLPKETDRCGKHRFLDNTITDGGHVFPCAVGIFIAQSGENFISHNEVSYLPYTGISVGWHWGYGDSAAKRNLIEANHVHHIGDGQLSDMGGIYTLGKSEGTIVKGNYIHHITSKTYGGWGLYTDEGSSEIIMENNLVHHTKSGGFHQHFGKDNIIRNNIFAYGTEHQIQFTRAEDHNSFTFDRNIILWNEGDLLGKSGWKDGKVTMDRNLYWKEDAVEPMFGERTLKEWRLETGNDMNSIIADPNFVDPKKGDYSFESDIAIREIGFVPFDILKAGPRTAN